MQDKAEVQRYLLTEVLPSFVNYTNSVSAVVSMDNARYYGQHFLKYHIDPNRINSRGDVYEEFEKFRSYAEVSKLINPGAETAQTQNMHVLANGVIWALEHDAFDCIKWDSFSDWGMDIQEA